METQTTLPIGTLKKFILPEYQLRKQDKGKVREYATKMSLGIIFPHVVLGRWTETREVKGKALTVQIEGIVDGIHRIHAAAIVKKASYPVEWRTYPTKVKMLEDQVTLNQHGAAIREGDRDRRIRLLAKENVTFREIGTVVGLSHTQVGRIVAGTSGAGKTGPRGKLGKRTLTGFPLVIFFKRLNDVNVTLHTKQGAAEIVELCLPVDEAGKMNPRVKAIALVTDTRASLERLEREIATVKKG